MLRKTYKAVYGLCSGYFPEGWNDFLYIWDTPERDFREIVKLYITERNIEERQSLVKEIEQLLKEQTEEELAQSARHFMLNYYPPGVGMTYTEWFREVSEMMKDSLEKESDNRDE